MAISHQHLGWVQGGAPPTQGRCRKLAISHQHWVQCKAEYRRHTLAHEICNPTSTLGCGAPLMQGQDNKWAIAHQHRVDRNKLTGVRSRSVCKAMTYWYGMGHNDESSSWHYMTAWSLPCGVTCNTTLWFTSKFRCSLSFSLSLSLSLCLSLSTPSTP